MKSKEWLFEAEQNVAKKKIDQQLDQLSDQEIDALLSMIDKSLDEGRFDYDPLADVPREPRPPKPQKQPQAPRPQPQQQKKQPQPQQKKSEVKAYVDDLANKQKETLKAVLQKEKEQRAKTGEKVSAAPKPAGKLVKLMAGILLTAGIVGGAVTYGPQAIDNVSNTVSSVFQVQERLLTGNDFLKMIKENEPGSEKAPLMKIYANVIDEYNGKIFKIDNPKNDTEKAELYSRILSGIINNSVNMFTGDMKLKDFPAWVQENPKLAHQEMQKNPIKGSAKLYLSMMFPVDNQQVKGK